MNYKPMSIDYDKLMDYLRKEMDIMYNQNNESEE